MRAILGEVAVFRLQYVRRGLRSDLAQRPSQLHDHFGIFVGERERGH